MMNNIKMIIKIVRVCLHFSFSHINVQATKIIALKFRANFSKRVAILLKCLSLANRFSTKWRSLYRYRSNSGLGFLLFYFRGMIGFIPACFALRRISSESYPLSAIKCSALPILSMISLAFLLS